jgi:ATP-dependent exoDNAse (exonuclease V) alpha subunit
MAIYYLSMKSFGRSSGKSGSRSTSAAAYRAGERIRDERSGAVYDHSHRRDVLHKQIVLPNQFAGTGARMDWARNRGLLWNAAEHAELRRNARVAREFTVALPHELGHAQRVMLARSFAQQLADRYDNAVDLVIHAPRGDPRNFHAHLLTTTREIGPEGFGRKTALELSDAERRTRGLVSFVSELTTLRERWATLTNEALQAAHIPARVSHLSRAAQGLSQVAPPRLSMVAYQIEKRGGHSSVAARLREQHREGLEHTGAAPRIEQTRKSPERERPGPRNPSSEEIRARAAQEWRAYRRELQERGLDSPAEAAKDATQRRSRARDDRSRDDGYGPDFGP